ncbi:hypothetical protein NF865_07575 [Thermococcus aggregans]|uniref:Uncharacterized protein n=1 Tax=Thermococcus aggregans TaxID=110163 RepID=A0A9E7MWI9_THEAG|nr:hypothetical protein [Thermococcus aggregans]USS40185.1 hypothetical protein NF865_07575 [Thermococcus aggregans]
MYKHFKILILSLLSLLLLPLALSEICEPYETYSITSVLPGSGWAFIVVHHSEWICETIAGEQTLRRNMPDGEYNLYYLFNGSNLLFLGKSNPLLGEPLIVTDINGTIYILQKSEEVVPYRNVTLVINGEARNLTITAKRVELKVYRFDGCASLVWNCTKVELQNGTIISPCEGNILTYFFTKSFPRNLSGIKGELRNGFLTFANSSYNIPVAEFEKYFKFSNDRTLETISAMRALPLGKGLLIYYPGEVKRRMGSFLSELPLVFYYGGGNLRHLEMSTEMQDVPECREHSQQNLSLNETSQTESTGGRICGIGTLLLLIILPLVWRHFRRKNKMNNKPKEARRLLEG